MEFYNWNLATFCRDSSSPDCGFGIRWQRHPGQPQVPQPLIWIEDIQTTHLKNPLCHQIMPLLLGVNIFTECMSRQNCTEKIFGEIADTLFSLVIFQDFDISILCVECAEYQDNAPCYYKPDNFSFSSRFSFLKYLLPLTQRGQWSWAARMKPSNCLSCNPRFA